MREFSVKTLVYAAATFAVLLLTFLLDWLYLNKDVPRVKLQSPVEVVQISSSSKARPAPKLIPQLIQIDLELPLPPYKQLVSPVKMLPPITPINTVSNEQNNYKKPIVNPIQIALKQTISHTDQKITMPVTDNDHIDKRIAQLSKLASNNRTFYFPRLINRVESSQSSTEHRQNVVSVLDYMHQCVGIDIGALDKGRLMLLSHKNQTHSKIMRVASGYFTPYETALLDSYAPNKPLVRLYPEWFDRQLSVEIQQALGNLPLTQISGEYKLINHRLYLKDILLNHSPVSEMWLLKAGC